MAGRFFVLSRRQNLASVREALLSAAEPRLSESFSRTDWLMIETLAQGASLKEIARQQSVSYHRVVYRLKQLITLLNLPHRQSFLRLIQQLNVTFHDIFNGVTFWRIRFLRNYLFSLPLNVNISHKINIYNSSW